MFERVFELLFKYRPNVFAQGDVAFESAWPLSLLSLAVLLAVGGAAAAVATYRVVRTKDAWRDRLVLAGLRLAAVAVILACLLRPVLVLKAAVPQQNFLAVLLDDSRSMQIADYQSQPRANFVRQQLDEQSGPLFRALADRFVVRTFRFSRSTDRLTDSEDLGFDGTETHLGQGLRRVTEELAGLPLAGVVVVSDGADTSGASLDESLRALRAQSVPVFTVGVGRETFDRDIQVGRVDAPRKVLKGTSLVVDVTLTHSGLEGTTVPIHVEDDGRIVGSQDVTLTPGSRSVTARVRVETSQPGTRVFRFRVPVQPGERVEQNNVRDVLIDVQDRREKILYFDGQPRFEVKFIRRAVADDQNLQVAVLQRTAENKYLRLDVDNAEHLAAGFPKSREELFSYRGLILGSVEASAFSPEQLRMIADFVGVRGGGLLMVGGRRAFAEGGYAGTPVDEVLPVVLDAKPAEGDSTFFAELLVHPTRTSLGHAVTQIGKDEKDSEDRWKTLPAVTTVNDLRRAKPGATILLTGTGGARQDAIVLAHQRFGRGKAIALGIQDSWSWQMDASISVDDMTHETFWRRLLRWLVDGVPDGVEMTLSTDHAEPGEPARLTARVVDNTFVEVNDARVMAHVTSPSGQVVDVPMVWNVKRSGEYQASFTAAEPGLHDVRVEAARATTALGETVSHLRAAPSDAEYFDGAMRRPLLQRVAAETGGRFYTPETVKGLAEDVNYTGRGVTVVEQRDLWDMPIVLLLLVGLISSEWTYRRARGLV